MSIQIIIISSTNYFKFKEKSLWIFNGKTMEIRARIMIDILHLGFLIGFLDEKLKNLFSIFHHSTIRQKLFLINFSISSLVTLVCERVDDQQTIIACFYLILISKLSNKMLEVYLTILFLSLLITKACFNFILGIFWKKSTKFITNSRLAKILKIHTYL